MSESKAKKFNYPENIDLDNNEFRVAQNLIENTSRSIFLTGRAGTGKSTFMRYILANTHKKFVVLAPTGIAAVNAGGQTMHSFFRLPFRPILPDDPEFSPGRLRKRLKYNNDLIRILKEVDLIVIDEISMVRADIIDIVDRILRVYSRNMRQPFGGKQLLMVGDIFQLEPVVVGEARDILGRIYPSPYFFNALVFKQFSPIPIELRKIYRQKDDADFAGILDRMRMDHASGEDFAKLNTRVVGADTCQNTDAMAITLTARRDTAAAINNEHLNKLSGTEFTYQGHVEGNFQEDNLPAPKELVLKIDAQVVFVRNDPQRRWVNGTIGRIERLDEDSVSVRTEDNVLHKVEPEVWNNIRYVYNEKERTIDEEIIGSYSQIPLQLAWAITIHKSQGLTFNNLIIDLGDQPAFAAGQIYVALSRCTSLDGITLRKAITGRDILVKDAVLKFSESFNNDDSIRQAIDEAEANRLYAHASELVDKCDLYHATEAFLQAQMLKPFDRDPLIQRFILSKAYQANKVNAEKAALESLCAELMDKLRDEADFLCENAESVLENDNDLYHAKELAMRAKKLVVYWRPYTLLARLLLMESDDVEQARLFLKVAIDDIHLTSPEPFILLGDLSCADPIHAMGIYMQGESKFPDNRKLLERIRHIYEVLEDEEGIETYDEKLRDLDDRNL